MTTRTVVVYPLRDQDYRADCLELSPVRFELAARRGRNRGQIKGFPRTQNSVGLNLVPFTQFSLQRINFALEHWYFSVF
jgi:hypothetical protein